MPHCALYDASRYNKKLMVAFAVSPWRLYHIMFRIIILSVLPPLRFCFSSPLCCFCFLFLCMFMFLLLIHASSSSYDSSSSASAYFLLCFLMLFLLLLPSLLFLLYYASSSSFSFSLHWAGPRRALSCAQLHRNSP